jgi:hypothetical protein
VCETNLPESKAGVNIFFDFFLNEISRTRTSTRARRISGGKGRFYRGFEEKAEN